MTIYSQKRLPPSLIFPVIFDLLLPAAIHSLTLPSRMAFAQVLVGRCNRVLLPAVPQPLQLPRLDRRCHRPVCYRPPRLSLNLRAPQVLCLPRLGSQRVRAPIYLCRGVLAQEINFHRLRTRAAIRVPPHWDSHRPRHTGMWTRRQGNYTPPGSSPRPTANRSGWTGYGGGAWWRLMWGQRVARPWP